MLTLRNILSQMYGLDTVDAYCVTCNHFTEHTRFILPTNTAYLCKNCETVWRSTDLEDAESKNAKTKSF